MVNGESMLAGLGLSAAAEAVYQALVLHPELGVAGLAGHTGLTDTEVRRRLDELAAVDLVRGDGRAGPPLAVGPEVGLAGLLARREAELAAERARIMEAGARVAAFVQHCHEWRTRNIQAGPVRPAECAGVRSEVLVFHPTPTGWPIDERVLRPEVTIRAICERVTGAPRGRGEVRTVPALPVRMVVVDRERALLPTQPGNPEAGTEVHTAPAVVAGLVALFEAYWVRARPVAERIARGGTALSEQDRELLLLLAEGATDETAARRLGVSARTVRRMAANVSQHLRARSRFQAGVRAAHQGLV